MFSAFAKIGKRGLLAHVEWANASNPENVSACALREEDASSR